MHRIRAIVVACIVTGSATVAAPASALGPGSTALISRPAFDPLPAGAVNDSTIKGNGAVSDSGRFVAFDSGADGLLAAPSRFNQVFRLDRLTGQIVLVSATPSGAPGSGDSYRATISDDGMTVAYQSLAQDLVAIQTHDSDDVFARNLAAPGTQSTLVSRASNTIQGPGAASNLQSFAGQISGDGRTVLFTSTATNLSAADNDPDNSVYLRELTGVFPQTILISRADGAAGASETLGSAAASLSDDGSVATFYTSGSGLDPTVPADANGRSDVYARDVRNDLTRLVSRASGNGVAGNADSYYSALSGDGRTVAFQSSASNLAAGDANGVEDVYKRTNAFGGVAATTTLVSRAQAAAQAGNGASTQPAISRDGVSVSFTSAATDLLASPDGNGARDAFVRDGSTTRVLTRNAGGAPAGGAEQFDSPTTALSGDGAVGVFSAGADDLSALDDDDFEGVYAAGVAGGPVTHLSRPAGLADAFEGGVNASSGGASNVSADGRYVAFTSSSDSLSGDDDDHLVNGYVRDVYAGRTILVSRASGLAGAAANGDVSGIAISADGSHVAFGSHATNLSPDDPDTQTDVYVRELATGALVLASRADGAGGAKANASASVGGLDADGSRLAFSTTATNLGFGADPDNDVFVRDLAAGTTVLASRADGAAGDQANANAGGASISADGNRVGFVTTATNMGDGDADARQDAHVRDLAAGTTVLASRADGPGGAKDDGGVQDAMLSADGNHVAFSTSATNLSPDDASAFNSAYVRDLAAGTTRLASRADGAGGASVAGGIFQTRVSGDGNRVVWSQFAGDLTGEALADAPQIFLRDLAASRTLLVSRGDGASGTFFPVVNFLTSAFSISGNGHCVVVTGTPDAGFSNPQFATPDFFQLYLRTVDGECAPAPLVAAPPPARRGGTDTVAPVVSALSLLRSRFAVDRRHPTPATAAAAARRGSGRSRGRSRARNLGTEFRFRLSEAASVRIAISRETRGKRKGRRCVKPSRRLRRARSCTRLVSAGTLVRTRRPAGANRIAFSGAIGRRSLSRGSYQAVLVATDAAGNRSRARTVRFRVVRPR